MIKINLAPEGGRRRRPALQLSLPSFNLGLAVLVVYALGVAGVGAYWWTLRQEEGRVAARLERSRTELNALKATIGQGARVRDELADLQKRVAAIQELTKNQGRALGLLDAFLDTIPQDLWITSLEEKGAVLKIAGTAFSTTAVSDFMTNLRRSGKFKDVDIVVARQDLAKSPRPVAFEVTCRFEG